MKFDIGPINNYVESQSAVNDRLLKAGELSLASDAQSLFAKSLVIISASYFEDFLKSAIQEALRIKVSDIKLAHFSYKKGIDRQFHTWFDWRNGSASPFFALFGDEFSEDCKKILKSDTELNTSCRDFIYIGNTRNEIVHRNFLTYSLTSTSEEIHYKAKGSARFLDFCAETIIG